SAFPFRAGGRPPAPGRWRSGVALDRNPGDIHVHPLPPERDALRFEQPALVLALGERAVGPDDPLPGNARVVAGREHLPGEPRGPGAEVAVGRDEALRDSANPGEDLPRPVAAQDRSMATESDGDDARVWKTTQNRSVRRSSVSSSSS